MASARAVLRNLADDERDRKAAAVDVAAAPLLRDEKRELLPPRADADARIDASDRSEGLIYYGYDATPPSISLLLRQSLL